MNNFFAGLCISTTILLSAASAQESIYHDSWIDHNKSGSKDPYEDASLPVDQRVSDLISRMTLDEKTCQMGTIYGYKRVLMQSRPVAEWKERVWKDGAGNIDEHGNGVKNSDFIAFDEHVELINDVQRWFIEETRLGVPVDFTNEGIRGLCHPYASNFPSQLGIGATWDKELVRRIGVITGKEAKALGYSNIYSPILDTVRDPRWGRTIECYGESPFLVGELGKQQALGIQSQGVASTVKHFAAYSSPHGGRDGDARTDPQIPYRDMHEVLVAPFRKVFTEAHPMGVMSSYNTYDGVPVTGSRYFLTELLRGQFGFQGYVVSDSGAVRRLWQQHKVAADWHDAISQAVNAGLNVRTDFKQMEDYVLPLREVVAQGMISQDVIDQRVADVLRVKFQLGLFDQPYGDPAAAADAVHTAEHEATTLEAARKSLVLLKNDCHALPLDPKSVKRVLVTGPGANDVGPMISRYGPMKSNVVTPYDGVAALLGEGVEVVYSKGCDWKDQGFPGSDLLPQPLQDSERQALDDAVAQAKTADAVIVVVGDNHSTVGEAHSRTSLDLPGRQTLLVQELAATGKSVIVVLMSGRAASINWIDKHVDGVLACWHGGEKVGQAVAEALFGEYNPGGRLPITFPQTVGQIPLAFPHRQGAWAGQGSTNDPNGWGSTRILTPLYYLGHGLSYTTFEYADLKLSPEHAAVGEQVTVSCRVTNSGDRHGDEVVQLYLSDVLASVAPFEQVLRGFERVSLAPGESRLVSFTLDPSDMEMLNRDNAWVVEPGEFRVVIGASSAPDAKKLSGKFTLE